jgi:hypothetical protein
MDKLLGILPYIYFEEPIDLGDLTFRSLPDWQGRDHAPTGESDRECLKELSACFPTTRGLSTGKGAVKAATYFLVESGKGKKTETLQEARKAITLLRYAVLRPDTQAVDNVESTYLYAFALPAAGSGDYHLYQCWPNLNLEQEIWISPKHQKFPLPGWYVDFRLIHTSLLEDIKDIQRHFYIQRTVDEEAEILLAMEWYNQSFLKYALRNIAGRLADISIAFEALFQLQKKGITLKQAITETLGVPQGSPIEHWAGAFYGRVRSATVHFGKPVSLLYQHPDAQIPHFSFLWSSQRIFRECISAKTGLPRHTDNDRLTEELVPNEVHLNNLKKAGSFQEILKGNMLEEVEKLKPIYPTGKREDIIWLGKELLGGYKERYKPEPQSLPALELILNSEDTGSDLGLQYYRFLEEFRPLYPNGYIAVYRDEASEEANRKLRPVTPANFEQFRLESAIYNFAEFAGLALLLPP